MQVNRKLFRLLIAIAFIVYAFLFILHLTDNIDAVEALQDRYISIRIGLAVLGVLGGGSVIYVWLRMLYHWRSNAFRDRVSKWGWLVLLLGINFLGAIVYYVTVVELGKGGSVTPG